MSTDPRSPEGNLGFLFRLAHQTFTTSLAEALEPLGLSVAQYGLLSAFVSATDHSSAELARRASVRPQTTNELVRVLVERDLLESRPDPDNQRILRLRLTRDGRALLDRATTEVRRVEASALERLPARDQLVVRRWLSGLAHGS